MKTLKIFFFTYFGILRKKNYFALLFSRQGLVIFPQNCLATTATGTEATCLVSVAVNELSKATKTGANFVPVAVAVTARDCLTKTIKCNRHKFLLLTSLLQLQFVQKDT